VTLRSDLASESGSGLVGYQPAGNGAVSTNVQEKLRETVSVLDFYANGISGVRVDPTGSVDSTAGIQAAINAASNGRRLKIPSGKYKITAPLVVPSNVTIEGDGRNFGTSINPVGCAAFTIDGSLYDGGWVFRITIKDLLITATNAAATNLITLKSSYNVDFKNVFVYNQPTDVTNGVYVSGSNNIVFEDFICYGVNVSVARAFDIDGATVGPVSLKLVRPDIEVYNRGIRATGAAIVDVFSPYMERCVVGYSHQISSGQANIYGGIISTVNGYGINVAGPNIGVYGTDIDPYQGGSRGGLGISAASTIAYQNVIFRGIPRISNNGFLDGATNHLTLDVNPSSQTNYYRRTLEIKKTLSDNVATNLADLRNFDSYAAFKLRLHGSIGTAYVIKEYQFIITASSKVSAVAVNNVLDTSAGNWVAVMSITLTPNAGAGTVMLSATVDTNGALGNGQSFTIFGELECVVAESGVGGIYLQ
jgi:hypothetical protein